MDHIYLNRLLQVKEPVVKEQPGMPRVAELSFQKFLEPIVSEIFDHQDVECGLKFLNLIMQSLHTAYLMGLQDAEHR